jgi:hypothetical protein
VTVLIYRHRPTSGYVSYVVTHHIGGKRQRTTFSDLSRAKKEAKATAKKLAAGEAAALQLRNRDGIIYVRKDKRIEAAWPVIAEAVLTVERWKFQNAGNNGGKKHPKLDATYEAFAKFFKGTVQDECVPDGIAPAIAWDDLAAKKKWTTSQLKKAQAVRGKLNVPRERFRQTDDGAFVWAGRT